MHILKVKKLDERAKLPVVATPEEDLAYDLFALEYTILPLRKIVKVRTGIAVSAFSGDWSPERLGLIIKDRSSMAAKGILTHGGVIDAGYTGEIVVLMSNTEPENRILHEGDTIWNGYEIKYGDKIAQMIPTRVLTGAVVQVDDLGETLRSDKGFGSSGSN